MGGKRESGLSTPMIFQYIFVLLELNFLKAAFKTFAAYCGGSGRLSRYSQKLSTSHSV